MDVEVTTDGVQRNSPGRKNSSTPRRWTKEYKEFSDAESEAESSSEWDSEASSAHNASGGSSRCKKGWLIMCVTFFLAAIVAAVVIVVMIPLNPKTNQSSSSFGDSQLTSDGAPSGLPEACKPAFNNVDYCLKNELVGEEVDDCVDCVWKYLPESTDGSSPGACQQLEASVCNVLSQCPCVSCASFLEEYLDCQSGCEFDCQLDSSAVERTEEDHEGV